MLPMSSHVAGIADVADVADAMWMPPMTPLKLMSPRSPMSPLSSHNATPTQSWACAGLIANIANVTDVFTCRRCCRCRRTSPKRHNHHTRYHVVETFSSNSHMLFQAQLFADVELAIASLDAARVDSEAARCLLAAATRPTKEPGLVLGADMCLLLTLCKIAFQRYLCDKFSILPDAR